MLKENMYDSQGCIMDIEWIFYDSIW